MAIQTLDGINSCAVAVPFMLPEDFRVYVQDGVILNWQPGGFEEITLPTYNDYLGEDGGYVALYTRDPEAGLYSVGDEGGSPIYVMGQVRVQGKYVGRIFVPNGYSLGDNITRDQQILATCRKYFPEMEKDFWVGGDTGGWFGIQNNVHDTSFFPFSWD